MAATATEVARLGDVVYLAERANEHHSALVHALYNQTLGTYVGSIAVSATGRIGWTGCTSTCIVQTARGGSSTSSTTATNVAAKSLRRNGRTLSWLRAGTRHQSAFR